MYPTPRRPAMREPIVTDMHIWLTERRQREQQEEETRRRQLWISGRITADRESWMFYEKRWRPSEQPFTATPDEAA